MMARERVSASEPYTLGAAKNATGGTITRTRGAPSRKGMAMQKDQRVDEMTVDVLTRWAGDRSKQTGESFEEAHKAVLKTEAGRKLGELRDGPHRDEKAEQWQESLARKRERDRAKERSDERERLRRSAAWGPFIQNELRELELRKNGQLARQLGEPLPGEMPAALRKLAAEDRRQAEEGLVALMSNGKTSYKRVDDLSYEDLPARLAASRLRTTWLKERMDGWLNHDNHKEAL